MKILVIVSETPPIRSGFSRVAEEINKRLRAAGHIVDTISSNDVPRLEVGEVRLSSMMWNGIEKVLHHIREYDIVHIHGPTPTFSDISLLLSFIGRNLGGPKVVYTHHSEVAIPSNQLLCAAYNTAHRKLAGLSDHVVVSTPSYASYLSRFLPENKISTIPWGVEPRQEILTKPSGFNVLFVGQLRPYKGLEVLLRAFQTIDNATLTVIGSGHRDYYYHSLAQKLGVKNVRFLGSVAEATIKQAYDDAHTVVLPSLTRAEAFGLVLLEGMAAGCVPIASRLPGVMDVLGQAGYTFEPGDHETLAERLAFLQHAPITLSQLSQAAKQRAAQFSWDTSARAYEHIFSSLTQGHTLAGANWFCQTPVFNPSKPVMRPVPRSVYGVSMDPVHPAIRKSFEGVVNAFGASRASLLLASPTNEHLVIAVHKGLDDALLGKHVPLRENSVAGWVAAQKQPVLINWADVPGPVHSYLRAPDLTSALSVPVIYENRVLGVLNLARHNSQQAYTAAHLDQVVDFVRSWKVLKFTTSQLPPTTLAPKSKSLPRSRGSDAQPGWNWLLYGFMLAAGLSVGFMLNLLNRINVNPARIQPLIDRFLLPDRTMAISYSLVALMIMIIGIRLLHRETLQHTPLQDSSRGSDKQPSWNWWLYGSGLAAAFIVGVVLNLLIKRINVNQVGTMPLIDRFLLPDWAKFIGYPMVAMITIIGIRLLLYFDNFFFHWPRYRQLEHVTNDDLRMLSEIPFVKIQITTRGTSGTTDVIRRGIQHVAMLVAEDPELYGSKLSVEVITESHEQQQMLQSEFADGQFPCEVFVLPSHYKTPKKTKLKARGLHYMVELRRQGLNRKPGKTFIVHYDEESVMEPGELRKLIRYLATTDKRLSEGPIYYPLEYTNASTLCRAMEANRPIGCFECQEVMERGMPLHLHGSNLVIDEELENELGWDIGTIDGQPFIAEDYVFGTLAYLKEGPSIFGWHGSVMLEQPPFSFKSAFRQRYRWVLGVLQGMTMMQRMAEFHMLPLQTRLRLIWGTRYRILTFALGMPTGAVSLLYLVYQALLVLTGYTFTPLPIPIMVWLVFVGFLWLNSILIGAWYNVASARYMSPIERWIEEARVLTIAPIAGVLESTAAFWAVVNWVVGNREVVWNPTPKTKEADKTMNWEVGQ